LTLLLTAGQIRLVPRTILTLAATAVALALTAQAAPAAITAKSSISTKAGASRIVVVLTSTAAVTRRARPKAVTVLAKGRRYRLSRAGASAAAVRLGTWRSRAYRGAAAKRIIGLAGAAIKVKLRSAAGTRTLSTRVAGATTPGGGTTPGGETTPGDPISGTPPGGGTGPLFPAPARATTGNEAFEAIKGYCADSRFTDCPAMWPNCAGALEHRYSHFANGDQYYCRLTATSGSDIRSYGQIAQISGAEHNADGSWGVEYYLSSYGNTTFYSWRVSPDGAVTGQYWGPGQSPSSGPATEVITGLQWVRGARDCSY
jgi:hypothetical protein